MKYLVAFIALIAFTFVSCDQPQAPTQPTGKTTSASKASVDKETNVDFGCFPVCDNPACGCVCVTANIHVVSNANGFHIDFHYTATPSDCETGEAIGKSMPANSSANFGANGGESNFVFTVPGGCKLQSHFTLNANGEVTVDRFSCE